jgi:hypothetical protein
MPRPKSRANLRLVSNNPEPGLGFLARDLPTSDEQPKFVPIRLLLALSNRCDCTDCCAAELAKRAGRPWVHPDVRERRPWIRAVQ